MLSRDGSFSPSLRGEGWKREAVERNDNGRPWLSDGKMASHDSDVTDGGAERGWKATEGE